MSQHIPVAFAFLFFAAACASPASEQTSEPTPTEIVALCETQPCRQTSTGPVPFVIDDHISIMAGEQLLLQATVAADRLTDFRVLDGTVGSGPFLTLEFEESSEDIVLRIGSTVDATIKFHILMRMRGEAEWYETSSCSLPPSGNNIELWVDPIEEFQLFDFRMIDPNSEEAGLCVY